MGAAELTSAAFWSSPEPHVLLNPARPEDAEGLLQCVGPGSWCLVQTSGTEGHAKWVALTKAAMLASAAAVNRHLEATAADRWLIALPTHHVGGFSIHARAFVSGASVVQFEGKWDAARFADVCENKCITLTSLVPTQVFDLVRGKVPAPECLRAIVVGGGGLSKEVGEAALELGWPVLQSFGMSEACSQIATEPLHHLHAGFDPDCLEVLPHWQLSTDAHDHLILKGPSLAQGYAIREAGGQWRWQAIDAGEGLLTRDQVSLWQHGTRRFLRFVGRESQALKIMGELVHLGPLQARLDSLAMGPGRAVLVPLPDERRGTRLVLACAGGEGEGLMETFNAGVQPFERVQGVVRVGHIPLTDLGKVKLGELRAMVAENGFAGSDLECGELG